MADATTTPPTTSIDGKTPNEKIPWYSLNPRHLRFSKWTLRLLSVVPVLFLLFGTSIKPLWQFGWRTHWICPEQFWSQKSATGKKLIGGDWVTSRKILVYGAPGVKQSSVEDAAAGITSVINELHLDLTVNIVSPSEDALHSLQAATNTDKLGIKHFDFDKFLAHRLDDRGMRFAEMVVVDAQFVDPCWAWGLTHFPSGTSVLQEQYTDVSLGRHEGTHLLGYNKHDDVPFYIIGYPENLAPANRDTLMMLLPKSSVQLSARARDAVLNFWHGLETKNIHYFKP